MTYEAQISRSSPTAFLFVVDQSGSMSDTMASGKSKAEFVADALNRTLMNLVTLCRKAEGVRDYFDVGVLGYGGNGVGNGFCRARWVEGPQPHLRDRAKPGARRGSQEEDGRRSRRNPGDVDQVPGLV